MVTKLKLNLFDIKNGELELFFGCGYVHEVSVDFDKNGDLV